MDYIVGQQGNMLSEFRGQRSPRLKMGAKSICLHLGTGFLRKLIKIALAQIQISESSTVGQLEVSDNVFL